MVELYLQRMGNVLNVRMGEHSAAVPLTDVVPDEKTWERIYKDAVGYGRGLFEAAFGDEALKAMLMGLPARDRVVLVANDPLAAMIPWEYLRGTDSKLLAGRLNFVRGVAEEKRCGSFPFKGALEIVALPVSPVDERRVLNVEREWKNLVEIISASQSVLSLKRVRPPTLSTLGRSQNRRACSIVHFIGHGASVEGKSFLVFEDARARSHLVDAADFAVALHSGVFLVVLNSCLSAITAHTEFGNIAQALVQRGIPNALGMQFVVPDDAALVLSRAFYELLVRGGSVEEAVMHTRRALQEPGKLPNPDWLAGIPVLYTSFRTAAPPIELSAGKPAIEPDPERLRQTFDVETLPPVEHFVGRAEEISATLDVLLAPGARGFVLLHGLGGIGKTSLARAIANRVGWQFDDRVLAVSFETFATLDANNQRSVNETFVDRFYNQLAHFYELDPSNDSLYPTTAELQQAILRQRQHLRSLLILDNIETLIDAQKLSPVARSLATFVSRLKEGDGVVLLTSRIIPPTDWGDCVNITVSGLSVEAGGSLLLALLPPDRRLYALPYNHRKLSERVKGHPLSIRLLAGRFAEATTDLETFLKEIDAELQAAEQSTPTSLEDSERQATLYACMDYSIKRLTPKQREFIDAISIFQAPFPPIFAEYILNDEEQTRLNLQNLVHLGLLNMDIKTFQVGDLAQFELHPMLRWYIQYHLNERDPALEQRYGEVYTQLARQAWQLQGGYDQSSVMRYLVRQSLPDFEAALQLEHLASSDKGTLAYYLAQPYQRFGQYRRALALYEQALEIGQELGDIRSVAVTQNAMAIVLSQQGRPQEALTLYEQSLRTKQELGDLRGVAVTQGAMGIVLSRQGKPQEAMALYKQALGVYQELGDVRGVAVMQGAMADLLNQQGRPQEALTLYEQSLRTLQELGDLREVSVTQNAMASLLVELGRIQDARTLYEESLRICQQLGEVQGLAVVQQNFSQFLLRQGEYNHALSMAWQAYISLQQHEYAYDAREIQQLLLAIKGQELGSEQFDRVWNQAIRDPQPDWLREVKTDESNGRGRISPEQLKVIVANPDKWREILADGLQQAQENNRTQDAEFFTSVLALLDGQAPALPEGHPYAQALDVLQAAIAAGGSGRGKAPITISTEAMQAVNDFVNTDDWDACREVVETRQALLFQPELEAVFEQNIANARSSGKQRRTEILEMHLALLRRCKAIGIAEAFKELEEAWEQEEDENGLPFDAELITRSVEALLGSAQERMAHMRYLSEMANGTMDERLEALINALQMALVGGDLSQLGRDLSGVYKQAWETITGAVEAGGVDPRLFDAIVKNMLAVLGPATGQRSVWRNDLVEVRNQATVYGDRNMVALLDAVIGLLDAGGHPDGLGEGLTGVYAKTWQEIIRRLPS